MAEKAPNRAEECSAVFIPTPYEECSLKLLAFSAHTYLAEQCSQVKRAIVNARFQHVTVGLCRFGADSSERWYEGPLNCGQTVGVSDFSASDVPRTLRVRRLKTGSCLSEIISELCRWHCSYRNWFAAAETWDPCVKCSVTAFTPLRIIQQLPSKLQNGELIVNATVTNARRIKLQERNWIHLGVSWFNFGVENVRCLIW
jgi:hypothetical protein